MTSRDRPRFNRPTGWLTAAMLGAALVFSGMLVAGGPTANGAGNLSNERRVILSLDWGSAKPGQGATGQVVKAEGLFLARQTGPKTRRGTRPMGIIAILVGLKAEQKYGLAFSTRRCGKGAGGLIGKKIGFSASPEGEAVVRRNYRLKRKVLRRSKSVVLLSAETGKRFQSCGRMIAGDFNGDGTVDGSDF